MLETTDIDNSPAELLYTINGGPSHGTILVDGTPATQFSQQQINDGCRKLSERRCGKLGRQL